MNTEQAAMMLKLQQIGLTMDDLQIYLDTHPYDANAIERFNMACSEYQEIAASYSSQFTPLSENTPSNNMEAWDWALSDFPWDF